MFLYHFSDCDVDILQPMIGKNRHDGEDPLAVDKPVIYLTNCSDMIIDGQRRLFRYTVEIDLNDPQLKPDRLFNQMMEGNKNIGEPQWFFYIYFTSITPVKKEKWNGKCYL
ncbi:hypothetical protein GPJ61_27605 [Brevibacillus formosus]|uniref:hypothetical protein n=1 Tax=Brevibacillus formosus TaxID=54913 RepID=UPI001CA5B514|nr:hypothetical protein [Brevibacillus formosus]MBW5471557.1 hypothetical protein [Brevibacillus formosus]